MLTCLFCFGLLFETAIRFLTADWACVFFAIAVLDCVYFQDCAVIPRLVGACGSDLKFFSGLRFQTAFIFETTVWNHSSVTDCTRLRFEAACLFASRNLSVNHLCVSTPRIVYDSICDTRLVFASWHRKRLGLRQATGASCVLNSRINYQYCLRIYCIVSEALISYCDLPVLSAQAKRGATQQRRCGVVGSALAFGSIGRGFESEHRLFSRHGASAFSKLRSLAKCSLDDSVRRLLLFPQLATLRGRRIE